MIVKRPYVIVNVAQSLNGFIAGTEGKRLYISNRDDGRRVQELRSSVDGILVGARTIINDNPRLMTDGSSPDRPLRVILDENLNTPEGSNVYDGCARTIVFTGKNGRRGGNTEMVILPKDELTIENILHRLSCMGVRRLLVEGGGETIREFIEARAIDEFYLFVGSIIAPGSGIPLFKEKLPLENVIEDIHILGDGILLKLKISGLTPGERHE